MGTCAKNYPQLSSLQLPWCGGGGADVSWRLRTIWRVCGFKFSARIIYFAMLHRAGKGDRARGCSTRMNMDMNTYLTQPDVKEGPALGKEPRCSNEPVCRRLKKQILTRVENAARMGAVEMRISSENSWSGIGWFRYKLNQGRKRYSIYYIYLYLVTVHICTL